MMNRKSRYYRTCPCCGAHLDPGERCDCEEKSEQNGKAAEPSGRWSNDSAH